MPKNVGEKNKKSPDEPHGIGRIYAGVFVPELVAQLVNYLGERRAGFDPFEVAELHQLMTRATSYWGHGGCAKNVISAIEIALWDLQGKALKLPVYELLGGARIEEIELYASGGLAKSLNDCVPPAKRRDSISLPPAFGKAARRRHPLFLTLSNETNFQTLSSVRIFLMIRTFFFAYLDADDFGFGRVRMDGSVCWT